jgi:hypothetical protein
MIGPVIGGGLTFPPAAGHRRAAAPVSLALTLVVLFMPGGSSGRRVLEEARDRCWRHGRQQELWWRAGGGRSPWRFRRSRSCGHWPNGAGSHAAQPAVGIYQPDAGTPLPGRHVGYRRRVRLGIARTFRRSGFHNSRCSRTCLPASTSTTQSLPGGMYCRRGRGDQAGRQPGTLLNFSPQGALGERRSAAYGQRRILEIARSPRRAAAFHADGRRGPERRRN